MGFECDKCVSSVTSVCGGFQVYITCAKVVSSCLVYVDCVKCVPGVSRVLKASSVSRLCHGYVNCVKVCF